MTSLISIIIPTYNRAHLIGETLDSILAQTYPNWECIIVDDGSIDETKKVIGEYVNKDSRFQYHHRPKERKKGPCSCRNYGFKLSKGDYIKWFDSDDVMHPNLLEKQLNTMRLNIDCSVCKVAYYDFVNNRVLKENTIYSDNLIEDYLVGGVTFYVSGPLWRKSFLMNQKQLFDETLSNLDDWDFNLRMLYQEPAIIYIDVSLIMYRIHEDSLSKEIVKCNFTEIISEFRARRKQLLILLFNNNIEIFEFKQFIIRRNKFYLRESLLQKNKCASFLFRNLLLTQFIALDVIGMAKSFIGYFGLKYFNYGYKFFR